MIKNIFLPEKIGNYYLFTKRIVGVDIGKTHINASLIQLQGNATSIEQCLEEKLEINKFTTQQERTVNGLNAIFKRLNSYNEIRTAISSSIVIFKELKVPFTNYNKIRLIINFEVEPLLPFSIHDAVIDFIITKTIPEEQSSIVLVAAVQKQHVIEHIALFEDAGLNPAVVTIDFFALYGLYQLIPTYSSLKGIVVLFDLGLNSTRIAFIQDGQLRLIRTLPQGTLTIAKTVSETLKIGANQSLENIIRFGLEENGSPEYSNAIKQALTSFWNKINFTILSFTTKMTKNQLPNQLLLLGGGAEIKGLPKFISELLNAPCELFSNHTIFEEINISVKNHIASTNIISISTALPSPAIEHFNLRKGELRVSQIALLVKQLFALSILTLVLFIGLLTHTIMQTNKLQREFTNSKQEVIEALKERFKNIDEEETDLDDAISTAQEEVKKEEETWFAFSSQARASFLKYLLELTNRIDKEALGFVAEKITIGEGTMILKARVKDFEALKTLERSLRQSKFFSIEPQNDPDFTMRISLLNNFGGK